MTDRLPLLCLQAPLLPYTDLGLHLFEPGRCALVDDCLQRGLPFGVVMADTQTPSLEPHEIGTIASIAGHARLADGRYLLEIEGTTRFQVVSLTNGHTYPCARVRRLSDPIGNFARARAASRTAERSFLTFRSMNGDADLPVRLPVDPVARSYVIASLLPLAAIEKQELLEIEAADERLDRAIETLDRLSETIDLMRSEHQ